MTQEGVREAERLDLSAHQLTAVPEWIRLTTVTTLDLSGNQLTTVPEWIGNLTGLTELLLYDNQLTALPETIGNLTTLTTLDISDNRLTAVPEWIQNLNTLTTLDLSGNSLTSLPETIGNLTALTDLRLYDNKLTSLPETIGNLTALTTLDLSGTELNLPEAIRNLTALTTLDLSHTWLDTLPEWIGNLTALTSLDLSDNELDTLPEAIGNLTALTTLDLSDNELETLPDAIGNLTALTNLDLDDYELRHWVLEAIEDHRGLTTNDPSRTQPTHGRLMAPTPYCVSDGQTQPETDLRHTSSAESQSEFDFDPSDPGFAEASKQLRTIAAWALRERSVDGAKAVWQLRPELDAPQLVLSAWEGFLASRLEILADPELLDADVGDLTEALLTNFDARRRQVLMTRVLSTQPLTLEEIGRSLGVTRARVGQMQALVERDLDSLLRDRKFLPLYWRAGDLAQALRGAAPSQSEDVKASLSKALLDCPGELTTTLTALLLRLSGPYTIEDGWYVRHGSRAPNVRELEKLVDDQGLLGLHAAEEWLTSQDVDPKHLDDWIGLSGRFRRVGDVLAVWSGSVVDKCVSVLALNGIPTDAETLVAQIGEGHNVRRVRSRLYADPRLVRTSRIHWGLRAWHLEEYTGITEEISQRIEEWGGQAKITDLADELVRLFGVSAASVRVYASAPMFVTEDGYVRLRRSGEEFLVESDLSRCRGVFKLPASSWSYLISVDRDVLRGSGRGFPGALAAALGVGPGKSRSFSTNGGQLQVSWPQNSGLGPSLGSTRDLATDAGAVEGDLLRLEFDAERGKCAGFRIPLVALRELSDDDAIKALTGLHDTSEDLTTTVACSIGTDSVHVTEVLRQRGDTKLAELLPPPQADDALKDALSELASYLDRLV